MDNINSPSFTSIGFCIGIIYNEQIMKTKKPFNQKCEYNVYIQNCALCNTKKDKQILHKNKPKDYGFIVRFKRRISKKERQRIISLMLKQKCVDNIQGALTFT